MAVPRILILLRHASRCPPCLEAWWCTGLLHDALEQSVDSGKSQCWHCAKSHNGMKSRVVARQQR
eukprot:CAMPEP_0183368460 /NCGR_PEP_ID=MMETSP0164_2-20130417/96065_1 /TAXON_ID=221442 /ORGANISM="Coccolithus pelagicus ssp braarudi, Strain PLY182g" /LENGTH=64 /DNA_ID=CAMNT_0025544559 /DNA_START=96 /DNA_END=287 /DNA_ORIENTATION=+